jgi:hypothetical protein
MFTFTIRAINPGAGPAYRTFKVLAADRFYTSEPPPAPLARNFNQTLNRLEEAFGHSPVSLAKSRTNGGPIGGQMEVA